jgi:hypothetical protein
VRGVASFYVSCVFAECCGVLGSGGSVHRPKSTDRKDGRRRGDEGRARRVDCYIRAPLFLLSTMQGCVQLYHHAFFAAVTVGIAESYKRRPSCYSLAWY